MGGEGLSDVRLGGWDYLVLRGWRCACYCVTAFHM